jgi:hypothetical protein
MNKFAPIILSLALFALTACQQNAAPKPSAEQNQSNKAGTSSQISLEVKPPVNQEAAAPSTTSQSSVVPNTVGMIVSGSGIQPAAISTKVGYRLMLYNSLDQQVELYTSGSDGKPCQTLGATIEIPGRQTKTFQLDKPFQCTIINQLNTDQKATLEVAKAAAAK